MRTRGVKIEGLIYSSKTKAAPIITNNCNNNNNNYIKKRLEASSIAENSIEEELEDHHYIKEHHRLNLICKQPIRMILIIVFDNGAYIAYFPGGHQIVKKNKSCDIMMHPNL